MSPRNPANCGAAARAIKNFGYRSLSLVALPDFADRDYLGEHARATAWRAFDVLQQARRPATLELARKDLRTLIAVDPSPPPGTPLLTLEQAAALTLEDPDGTGLLFGRENDGLHTDELAWCTHAVVIPTAPEYGDLNLAQSVLLVAWMIFQTQGNVKVARKGKNRFGRPANLGEIADFSKRAAVWLKEIDYFKADHAHAARTLLRLLLRARPRPGELTALLGIFSQARWREKKRTED
jgi:tRNA/rRNA methyltransferase